MSRNRLMRRPLAAPFMSSFAREVDQLQNSIDQMFENPFAMTTPAFTMPQTFGWMPAVDVTETDTAMKMTVELPGIDQKDVHIELDGQVLTLRGEKVDERVEGDKKKDFYLEERSYGAFQRSFTLPPNIDVDKITASFDKGVLTLQMPKMAEVKPRGREITIAAK